MPSSRLVVLLLTTAAVIAAGASAAGASTLPEGDHGTADHLGRIAAANREPRPAFPL